MTGAAPSLGQTAPGCDIAELLGARTMRPGNPNQGGEERCRTDGVAKSALPVSSAVPYTVARKAFAAAPAAASISINDRSAEKFAPAVIQINAERGFSAVGLSRKERESPETPPCD
jgi:hypothetical protein